MLCVNFVITLIISVCIIVVIVNTNVARMQFVLSIMFVVAVLSAIVCARSLPLRDASVRRDGYVGGAS